MLNDLFMQDDGRPRQTVAWGGGLLVMAVAGYLAYAAWANSDGPQDVTLMCTTPGCAYQRERPLHLGEALPLTCPKCGKRSVAPAFRCPKCGTPNLWNEDRGMAPPTKCTTCGHEVRHG